MEKDDIIKIITGEITAESLKEQEELTAKQKAIRVTELKDLSRRTYDLYIKINKLIDKETGISNYSPKITPLTKKEEN